MRLLFFVSIVLMLAGAVLGVLTFWYLPVDTSRARQYELEAIGSFGAGVLLAVGINRRYLQRQQQRLFRRSHGRR